MIIDNSELIRPLLGFLNEEDIKNEGLVKTADYFYVVQLIQRKKDNPTRIFVNPNHRNNSNKSLYQTQIYSEEDFNNKLPLIIELAKVYQARAYINLNLKSSYKAFINLVKNIGCRLETSNYKHLNRIYNEAVGEVKGAVGYGDRWIVDIDRKDDYYTKVMIKICDLRGGHDGHGYVYQVIPTKSGFHLITSSFDLEKFRKWEDYNNLDHVDIHKDNPTILWMNTDWSEGVK